MENIIKGKILKYGDNINTDIISPPQYMELSIGEAARYAMSAVDPDFHLQAGPEAIMVAGRNLGSGSSRETSPLTLKYLGLRVIVAEFFARIFYRNCINVGLIPLACSEAGRIETGDALVIDLALGQIRNQTKAETYGCDKIPDHIMKLIEQGGLVASLTHKFAAENNGQAKRS